jgi:sirohydrochlorin cobaltochelatase
VRPQDFADATLVLLGHGTGLNPESAASVYQHAAALRRTRQFADVREAFWKQEPQVKQVLASTTAPRVFLVPLFISEGYFNEEVIPRELGFRFEGPRPASRVLRLNAQALYYAKPIGTHDRMTGVLLGRAREIVARFPFPRTPKPKETALVIAGHGTERNENSRAPIDRQVQLIRALDIYASVHAVFLDEEPRIAACYDLAAERNMIVVPFFISDGLHAQEDIPRLLGEPERIIRERLQNGQPSWRNPTERKGKLVWYTASVGTDPQVVDVILERVREAASWS